MVEIGLLQRSIFTALSSISCPIYDDVPEKASYPYVRYDSEEIEDNSTKTTDGTRHVVYLNIFSKYQGFKEVKDITNEVISVLKVGLVLSDEYTACMHKTPSVRIVDDIANGVRQSTITAIIDVTN